MPASHLRKIVQLVRQALRGEGSPASDGQLLECFLVTGEEAAFEEIVRRHGRMVLAVCQRVLKNAHDAEDAFQATFLVVVRKAGSLLSRQTIGDWLYGVAYHTSLKARSANIKRRLKEGRVSEMREDPAAADLWRDLQPLLDRELSRLPAKYRSPVVLCDLEGKTRKEAADLLGWPEGTVSGRLARARVLLGERLTRQGLAVSGGALGVLLAQNGASAGLPSPLLASTTKAAALAVGGQALAACAVSTEVAALTDGVLKGMALAKLKVAAALVLVLGLVGSGAGVLTWQLTAAGPPADSPMSAVSKPRAPDPGPASERQPVLPGPAPTIPPALLGKSPRAVQDAVLAMFPRAVVDEVEKEDEGGKVVYDVTLKHEGQNIELQLSPEGMILKIVKEIQARELPPAVTQAMNSRFPGARFKQVEAVFKVQGSVESLAFYDIVLQTAGKKRTLSVEIAPDGRILKEERD